MSSNDDELTQPILRHQQTINNSGDEDNELNEQLTGCAATSCCNPSSRLHRFQALFLMCLLGFGSYFCYDNPGALQDNFKKDMDLSTTEFVMLYSIYSWPNVILCFIGGFLIDRVFGIRVGTIIYMFILMIGQLLFAMGGILDAFWLMIVGRFIFGIGAESLAVAQNNYAVLWFKGKELNMVFGFQLSFARVGSTVNFMVMEPLYKYINQYYKGHMCTGVVLLLASLTCLMSFACALLLGWMDKRAQRILKRNDNPNGEIAKLSDVVNFKMTFWMVSVICVAYYVAIYPFIALGKVFFMRKFGFSASEANTINSSVYLISAFLCPLFGIIIDVTGRNVMWVFVSIAGTIVAHSLLAFTFLTPYIGMAIMGFAYSMLASSLWPLVALIIPEYQLGTAYGICQSVQNLGLAIITMVSGIIVDNGGFFMLEISFIAWLNVALIATIVIWLYDTNHKGNLNMTPSQRLAQGNQIISNVSDKLMVSASAEEISPEDVIANQPSPILRNRYLNRVGVEHGGGGGSTSDTEPLLQQ